MQTRLLFLWLLLAMTGWSSRVGAETAEERIESWWPPIVPPADRALAAEWLGKLRAAAAFDTLLAMCADPDGGVRYSAVQALGELGDPRATEALEKLAVDPQQEKVDGAKTFTWREVFSTHSPMQPKARIEYDVRQEARMALVHLRPVSAGAPAREPREAIADLAVILEGDLDDAVNDWRASKALRVIGEAKTGPDSARILVEALRHHSLESQAANALAVRTDQAEIMDLLKPLLARPDLASRTLAECLKVVQQLRPSAAPALARRLLKRMKTNDATEWGNFPWYFNEELRATLRLEDLPALDDLLHFLATSAAGPTSQPNAAQQKARQTAVLDLRRFLTGKLPESEESLKALDVSKLRTDQRPVAIEFFLRELVKPGNEQRPDRDEQPFLAAYQLGNLRARKAVPDLLTLLDGEAKAGYQAPGDSAGTRPAMAAWALIQIADPASVSALHKWAQRSAEDFEQKQGFEALIAYGALAGDEAIPDLARVLQQPVPASQIPFGWRMPITLRFYERLPMRNTRAIPSFFTQQEAAAFALSQLDSPRAQEALLHCLEKADGPQMLTVKVIEAIFRVAPRELEAWSTRLLEMPEGEHPWSPNSLRITAVAVQLRFFSEKSTALFRSILTDKAHPLRGEVVNLLRTQSQCDESVSAALAGLLEDPLPEDQKQHREAFGRRLWAIDALGVQGDATAVAALLQVAKGR